MRQLHTHTHTHTHTHSALHHSTSACRSSDSQSMWQQQVVCRARVPTLRRNALSHQQLNRCIAHTKPMRAGMAAFSLQNKKKRPHTSQLNLCIPLTRTKKKLYIALTKVFFFGAGMAALSLRNVLNVIGLSPLGVFVLYALFATMLIFSGLFFVAALRAESSRPYLSLLLCPSLSCALSHALSRSCASTLWRALSLSHARAHSLSLARALFLTYITGRAGDSCT
jgi:hypothetical protein